MQVTDHARQLLEKHMRKPFFDGGYAGSMPRMTAADLEEGLAWVDDRFFPIRYEDEALPSVDWVLNVAKAAVLRWNCAQFLPSTCIRRTRFSFLPVCLNACIASIASCMLLHNCRLLVESGTSRQACCCRGLCAL